MTPFDFNNLITKPEPDAEIVIPAEDKAILRSRLSTYVAEMHKLLWESRHLDDRLTELQWDVIDDLNPVDPADDIDRWNEYDTALLHALLEQLHDALEGDN